jgi:hypothetical protein
LNPRPTLAQLEQLSMVVGVSVERLLAMLPPDGVGMKHEPIRLCAACYGECPCHRIEWQFKETRGCDRHQLTLLSECPNCGSRFGVPSSWVEGSCQRCFMAFPQMQLSQRVKPEPQSLSS